MDFLFLCVRREVALFKNRSNWLTLYMFRSPLVAVCCPVSQTWPLNRLMLRVFDSNQVQVRCEDRLEKVHC